MAAVRKIIESGTRFGKLTVIEPAEDYVSPKGDIKHQYLCKCDCGNKEIIRQSYLTSGKQLHCNKCANKSRGIRYNYDHESMIGARFGRWTVIKEVDNYGKSHRMYLCRCDCGNEGIVASNSLRSGNSRSCGCLSKELCKDRSRDRLKVKDRPSREELKDLIRHSSFLQIGRRYGVSDNAIRKWCIEYNLPYKSREIDYISDSEWASI